MEKWKHIYCLLCFGYVSTFCGCVFGSCSYLLTLLVKALGFALFLGLFSNLPRRAVCAGAYCEGVEVKVEVVVS